jgi:hypothetical protein
MGDFVGTITIKSKSPRAKTKRIKFAGKTTEPKRRQALVKELKKLAAKYKFKVAHK